MENVVNDVVMETIDTLTKEHTVKVLQEMMAETNNCFNNFDAPQLFAVQNFIDSFIREQ